MNSHCSLILASGSPRRQALIQAMGYRCTVIKPTVEEDYPADMPIAHVPVYLAKKKALSVQKRVFQNKTIIAADTVVIVKNTMLAKPANRQAAINMLVNLSGTKHTVITGVCILGERVSTCFSDRSTVWFTVLNSKDIAYYVDHFNPFDKAGGYGIQDWIGLIGIESIRGAYTTVMGLPTHKVYAYLNGNPHIE